MRDELKQREAELEKSLDDKQQLKNQVQTLKEGLQNLKNTHRLQVSFTRLMFFHNRGESFTDVLIAQFPSGWLALRGKTISFAL